MDLPVRKENRLRGYDYGSPGAYFITICTRDRRCILSKIEASPPNNAVGEGLAPPAVILSEIGNIVETEILRLTDRFPDLRIDRYVIMPNHIHLLLTIKWNPGGASPSPTTGTNVSAVIGPLKSLVTIRWHKNGGEGPLWQRSYHDHIVRAEEDYRQIAEYIDRNPAKWSEDRFCASGETTPR